MKWVLLLLGQTVVVFLLANRYVTGYQIQYPAWSVNRQLGYRSIPKAIQDLNTHSSNPFLYLP